MSDLTSKTATSVAEAFLPAEKAQHIAAIDAARALTMALESHGTQGLSGPRAQGSLEALSRGVNYAVQAHLAFADAHRQFVVMAKTGDLAVLGWGCPDPDCPPIIDRPTGSAIRSKIFAA